MNITELTQQLLYHNLTEEHFITSLAGIVKKGQKQKGKLIVFEGLDGSGKTTQLNLLESFLKELGFNVITSFWNSSEEVGKIIKEMKKEIKLRPSVYSLLQAADLAQRLNTQILPALEKDFIVLCDRYFFTALARDSVRGLDEKWLMSLFSFAPQPHLVFYIDIPIEIAIKRVLNRNSNISLSDILKGDLPLKYYEAGLDTHLDKSPFDNFHKFQTKVAEKYKELANIYHFYILDGTQSISDIHSQIIKKTKELLDLTEDEPQKYVIVNNLRCIIEWLKGQVRPDENKPLQADYGYIPNTIGSDGMALDVFIGPNLESTKVFKIKKIVDNEYEQDKFMLGFDDEKEAVWVFVDYFGWDKFGGIEEWDWDKFIEFVELNRKQVFEKTRKRISDELLKFLQRKKIKDLLMNPSKFKLIRNDL